MEGHTRGGTSITVLLTGDGDEHSDSAPSLHQTRLQEKAMGAGVWAALNNRYKPRPVVKTQESVFMEEPEEIVIRSNGYVNLPESIWKALLRYSGIRSKKKRHVKKAVKQQLNKALLKAIS